MRGGHIAVQTKRDWRTITVEEIIIQVMRVLAFSVFYMPLPYAVSDIVYTIWRLVVCIVGAICILMNSIKYRVNLEHLFFSLFVLSYYVLSSLISSTSVQIGLYYSVKVIGFAALIEYGMQRDKESYLKAFIVAGCIMCSVHYLTFLMYRNRPYGMLNRGVLEPDAISRHPFFFLTHDNGSIFYFLPVLACLWYYSVEYDKSPIIPSIASVLTLYMYLYLGTVTAIVVTILFSLLILFRYSKNSKKIIHKIGYRKIILAGLILCVLITVFKSNDLITSISSDLGKRNTLSGRVKIWDLSLSYVKENLLFGVGYEIDSETAMRIGFSHCHNIILQVLYTGGIISLVLMILFMLSCDPSKRGNHIIITTSQYVLCIYVLCIAIASAFDWYLYMPVMFAPFILYRYSKNTKIGRHYA